MSTTMTARVKTVIEICMRSPKSRSKAMSAAAGFTGVVLVALKGERQLEVIGMGLDTVKLANLLRKKVGHAQLVNVSRDGEGGFGNNRENGGSVNNPTAPELPPICNSPCYCNNPNLNLSNPFI